MSADVLIPVGVAVVAILAAVAAFTIAWRRSSGAEWRKQVEPEAVAADRSSDRPVVSARQVIPEPEPDPEPEPEPEPEPVAQPLPEPVGVSVATVQRTVEISPEEAGVTRRMFFNRAIGYIFLGAFGGTLSISFLSFLWPRLEGGFGSDVVAGAVTALSNEAVNDDGSVTPVFIPEARAYIVPAPAALSEQFADIGVEAGGLMALYQRCVHLGCRVPWCQTSQGFECPCHGSKYNGVGEYFAGPAPRNLDRFAVEVNGQNELVIITSSVIETPRALDKSVEYPQGVSCIGGV